MLATSFAPYAALGYPVAAVALALLLRGTAPVLRRWVGGGLVLALAGTVLHVALLVPAYAGDHPTGKADLVVMSLNLRLGHGDAEETVALAGRRHADVLVLAEVTAAEEERLEAAGISGRYPYRAGEPGPGASGTMVFSRFALSEPARLPTQHGSYRVKVAAPVPFWLVAVHLAQPLGKPGHWQADWGVLGHVVPALDGPVVLAGDFNSTVDHGPFRDLLGEGFEDAARQSNAGWQPTWPSGGIGLLPIDHVITRAVDGAGYAAISTRTDEVANTDHRALVARLGTP